MAEATSATATLRAIKKHLAASRSGMNFARLCRIMRSDSDAVATCLYVLAKNGTVECVNLKYRLKAPVDDVGDTVVVTADDARNGFKGLA